MSQIRFQIFNTICLAILLFLPNEGLAQEVEVLWSDLEGASVTTTYPTPFDQLFTLTKTAGAGWGNGGGASHVKHGGDIGLAFAAGQTHTFRIIGLSSNNQDSNWDSVEYGIYLKGPYGVHILERGDRSGKFWNLSIRRSLSH